MVYTSMLSPAVLQDVDNRHIEMRYLNMEAPCICWPIAHMQLLQYSTVQSSGQKSVLMCCAQRLEPLD